MASAWVLRSCVTPRHDQRSVQRSKTQLGSRSCDRLPCRRTSIRLASRRSARAIWFRRLATSVLLANERRQVSQVARLRGPKASATSRFRSASIVRRRSSLRPLHRIARRPPRFAVPLAGLRPKTLRSAARAARSARRHIQRCDCSTPKARRPPESRAVPPGLTRRPTRLHGSVVGAGRDHPKSLSIPGHRRPTKTDAEASSFVLVAPAPFLSRRLTGLTGGSPLQPMIAVRRLRPCSGHR